METPEAVRITILPRKSLCRQLNLVTVEIYSINVYHRSPAELRLLYVLNFLNSYMYFSTAMVLPLIGRSQIS